MLTYQVVRVEYKQIWRRAKPKSRTCLFLDFPTIMVYFSFENSRHRRYLCLTWYFLSMKWLPFDGLGQILKFANLQMHLNLNGLKTHTGNGKRLTLNCSLRFAVNVDLKVSNQLHLTSNRKRRNAVSGLR